MGHQQKTAPVSETPGNDAVPAVAVLPPGHRVGPYVLEGALGRGGDGIVYAANDPALSRQIALKILLPPAGGDNDHGLRQARALASLDHPNVAQVHDARQDGDTTYLAMELVEGPDLSQELRRDDLEVLDKLRLLLAAGRGLGAAHSAGIVHGDFKPANVVIESGRVRVTDFGVSRARATTDLDSTMGDDEPIEDGSVDDAEPAELRWGTAAYAAPELFEGAQHDQSSDVYAFCVTLFEALYGVRPFRRSTVRQLYCEKMWPVPILPHPTVTPTLRRLLGNGLHPNPEARPQSLEPLLAELETITRKRRGPQMHVFIPVAILAIVAFSWLQRDDSCEDAEATVQSVWNDSSRDAARDAMTAAASAPAWTATERAIDDYTRRWVELRSAACRSSEGHTAPPAAEQLQCLDDRLSELGVLVDGLAKGDGGLLSRGPASLSNLPSPSDCTDDPEVAGLAAPVR